ncbi:exopolysaccharide biosynthesis protein [Variovorax humicola]|uniref:Exopolysaccharide biosynthesis protein n=1 Tax=Variovorax humicola TaxID=1769758 RepID=A0ABU8W925_9BURK
MDIPREADRHGIDIDRIARLAADQTRRRVSVGDIMAAMGNGGTLMLTLLFALPNAVPALPGTSTILGLPLLFLTVQLARDMTPRVPWWIARQSVRRTDFAVIVERLRALFSLADGLSSPRLGAFAGARAVRFAGGLGIVLSMVLILPLPLVNVPIGVALVLMALGGLRADGLLMALGMTAGVGSLAFSAIVIAGLVKIGSHVVAPLHF